MRYPSLVFLSSTLPFLPWPGFVRWLSACTRRPPLCPRVVEREFKASYGRTRREEREREREKSSRIKDQRTARGEKEERRARDREHSVRQKRTNNTGEFRRTSERRGDETGHDTKHRIKRPKFRGGTIDSHDCLLPFDFFSAGFKFALVFTSGS